MRAIELLQLWGSCVLFGGSELLAKYLVVDPTFLTQKIMSSLFHPDHAKMIVNGILLHHYLRDIWPDYVSKAEFLLALMEKFEVCFELGDRNQQQDSEPQQPKKDFWGRESVITSYLPEQPASVDFNRRVWTDACPMRTSELCRDYTFNIIPKELVSRLLVRLHPKMEEKALWKNGLFLESPDHLVKILMRVNIEKNRLVIAVRGAEMSVAKAIMSLIATEIVTVSKNYAGITMKFEESEVNGDVARKWWELTPSGMWEKKGAKGSEIQSFSFYSNGVGRDDELVNKLKVALWGCGGSLDDVEEAFALHNPNSLKMFDGFRANLYAKEITAPCLFKRDHWRQKENANVRADFVAEHEKHLAKFDWNTTEQLKVSLMVQGTTTEAGWSIARGGFGVVSSIGDYGWFGRGIYTTSHLKYASKYAETKAGDIKTPALLICVIIPGNILPVVEVTYYGKPVANGYQSHFTIGK